MTSPNRERALTIWRAAVEAVRPEPLVERAVAAEPAFATARRILVVGSGKAGPGMALGLERALEEHIDKVQGLVNVPAGMTAPLKRVRLHEARPPGVNEPRPEGVAGTEEMLELLAGAGLEDVAVCLLSGGGSALLPAPADGITLADKLAVTRLLHKAGATIDEMNCVRKHLSRVKGGQLARSFSGSRLISYIISDVVGDPLDVIASGPTAPDPTTFAEALTVLNRCDPGGTVPASVRQYLEAGVAGSRPETPKSLPESIENRIIGSNRVALDAARAKAEELGYRVLDLGSFIEGETRHAATVIAGLVRGIQRDHSPLGPPVCVLMGGETTVTLGQQHGKGGRNQEFVLAMLAKLGRDGTAGVTVLSGGTDGEDGPTDAAGACGDAETLVTIGRQGLLVEEFLSRHDAYTLFEKVGGLIQCGLTGTNVMDVRIVLVEPGGKFFHSTAHEL
jgi:hydroxypyruvate reductase/glycerate 2-kinase